MSPKLKAKLHRWLSCAAIGVSIGIIYYLARYTNLPAWFLTVYSLLIAYLNVDTIKILYNSLPKNNKGN